MYKYKQEFNEVQKSLKVQLVNAVKQNMEMNKGHMLTGQQWQSKKELTIPQENAEPVRQFSYRDIPLTNSLKNKVTQGQMF